MFTFLGVASLAQELAPVDPLLLHDVGRRRPGASAGRAEPSWPSHSRRAEPKAAGPERCLGEPRADPARLAGLRRGSWASWATTRASTGPRRRRGDEHDGDDGGVVAALNTQTPAPRGDELFQAFHREGKDDANVVHVYFSLVAASVPHVLEGGDEKEEEGGGGRRRRTDVVDAAGERKRALSPGRTTRSS